MAREGLSASGHSWHISISSENSGWWLTMGFFPVKCHTACSWAFWTYAFWTYVHTYTHSVCPFSSTDGKWGRRVSTLCKLSIEKAKWNLMLLLEINSILNSLGIKSCYQNSSSLVPKICKWKIVCSIKSKKSD